jgi:hypothetical protein
LERGTIVPLLDTPLQSGAAVRTLQNLPGSFAAKTELSAIRVAFPRATKGRVRPNTAKKIYARMKNERTPANHEHTVIRGRLKPGVKFALATRH